jgi:WD40 repeat protein
VYDKQKYDFVCRNPVDHNVYAEVLRINNTYKLEIKNYETKKKTFSFEGLPKITCVSWCPLNENLFVFCDETGRIMCWDLEEGIKLVSQKHEDIAKDIVWHHTDPKRFFTVGMNGSLYSHEIKEGRKKVGYRKEVIIYIITSRDRDKDMQWGKVCSIAWHPETWHPERKYILVVGFKNGEIKFFDVRDWSCKKTLKGQEKAVTHLQFHPKDPKILVSGSRDGMVRLWRFGKGYNLYKKQVGPAY